MATLQNLLDDLNDRLTDVPNAQAGQPRKIGWINAGIGAMWPKLYKTIRDNTLVVAANTYEYVLPAVFAHARVITVEAESASGSGRYTQVYDTDILPDLAAPVLVFRGEIPQTGAKVRVTAAKKITDLAAVTDTYDGPPGSEELPVLYAMGIASGRRLDDKIDHRRYAATQAPGTVSPNDLMDAAQFWLGQFELILDRQAMPLPAMAV